MMSCIVSEKFFTHPVTSILQRSVQVVIQRNNFSADYKCGAYGCILRESRSFSSNEGKKRIVDDVKSLRSVYSINSLLIVWVTTSGTSLALYNLLNMEISLSTGTKVVLCWSPDQVASLLSGIAASTTSSVELRGVFSFDGKSIIPNLQNAFYEIGLLQSADVVRLVNKNNNVSDVLLSRDDELTKIPGFGDKKIRRLMKLLDAPFMPSTLYAQKNQHNDSLLNPAMESDARRVMHAALKNLCAREDEEE